VSETVNPLLRLQASPRSLGYRPVSGFTLEITDGSEVERDFGDATRLVIGTSSDRTLSACLEYPPEGEASQPTSAEHTYFLGDSQDADPDHQAFLGHGVLLHANLKTGQVCIYTSLSGVPPVFVYREGKRSIVASSVRRIAALRGGQLTFDPQGLVELAAIGHPIDHRTLFRNISVIPAGVGLAIDALRGVRTVLHWQPPVEPPFRDLQEYLTAQSDALTAAVARMDLSRSFLSLTAGLDTRTILALLVRDRRTLPALTMSSIVESIDARRAAELCRSYGMTHNVIRLNEAFIQQFPECALEASRRSGGLSSFGQASEVFFYRVACNAFTARLSGNLGNQVGRSCTESARMRGVPQEILACDVISATQPLRGRHWLAEMARKNRGLGPLELIQLESLFASMGNSCIGGSYVTQQTPYADRTVISQKLREPVLRSYEIATVMALRLRDLRYRFLGDPIRTSFQRQIVASVGGMVARTPVNWGWRPAGAVSLAGIALGTLGLLDMIVNTRLARRGVASRITARIGIDGFSGFQYVDLLRERPVADFVNDTLHASAAQQSPVLNPLILRRALAKGLDDHSARATLLFALDVVLAWQNFGVTA
jgi:hypothetical protein